jgi:hypothetical protein
MSYKLNPFTNNFDYYDGSTGSTVSQDLSSVLGVGNSAGGQDIDMDLGNIKDIASLDFDSTSTLTPFEGQMGWDNNFGTLNLGLKGGSVKLQIGQQEFARVVNKTVPNIDLSRLNYQVCVVVGATGQRLSVKLAKADSDLNSAGTLGVVAEDILKNQEGFICTTGTIENLNTSGSLQGETWVDGDILYLSPSTAGAMTNVKPIAPQHLVVVGYVEYAHANKGKIYVKIDNGYELNELHNVAFPTTPIDKNLLGYVAANNRWENRTVDQAIGFTPAPTSRNLTINGTTQDLSADRTFTVTDVNLSTSDVTDNNVSTSKHGFVPKAPATNGAYLEVSGTAAVWIGLIYTIELIDVLTVDFYAPYNLKINTISNVLNSPTTTILDDGASYTLTNTIATGSKITITVNTAAVINLNITKA